MFSHITVGTNDLAKAGAFYDAVFAALGLSRGFEGETFISYGERAGGRFFVMVPYDGNAASVGNGVHAAFRAADRASVDAFHTAALSNGGSDEGVPGLRPHYHENYYGAYVRDPDGNKLQAVCHDPE
ncbi:MAG: VOC family protein [Alphaproteobacteria bacterium]